MELLFAFVVLRAVIPALYVDALVQLASAVMRHVGPYRVLAKNLP